MKTKYVVTGVNDNLECTADKVFSCKLRARSYENMLLAKGFTTVMFSR